MKTWLSYLLGVAAAIAVGLFGFQMAHKSTFTPTVPYGGVDDHVEVWVNGDAPIWFAWSMDSSGEIYIITDIRDSDQTNDPGAPSPSEFPDPLAVTVVLQCNSRVQILSSPSNVTVKEGGIEEDCNTTSADAHGAWQAITIPVGVGADQPSVTTMNPITPWTVSGSGNRVARFPQIDIGDGDNFMTTSIDWDLKQPAAGSEIQISLEFDSTESLTSYLPTETVGHAYEVEALPVSSAIGTTGRIRWNSAPGEGLLPTGEARWSVPSAQATAQLNLLIAGALLGIAASVAVELLLEFLRSFRQKPTPPRRT